MTALTTINQTDVFDDQIDEYIEQENEHELERTDRRKNWSYYYAAKQFVKFAREEGLGIVDGIRQYADSIAGEKTNTYNHKLGAAKKLARHMIDTYAAQMSAEQRAGLYQALDDLKLKKRASIAVEEDKYLSEDEWRQFLARCRDDTVRHLAAFMYETGTRISEALEIKLSEIKYDKKVCTVYIRGKGGKDGTAEINRKTLELIRDHFAGETWLFEHERNGERARYSRPSIAQRFRLAGLESIGRPLTPHMMRHSFATRLDEEGRPLQQIQRLLRHSSPVTTEGMYMHAKIPKGERHISSGLDELLGNDGFVKVDPEDEAKTTEKLQRTLGGFE